jgi:hypothetical protein
LNILGIPSFKIGREECVPRSPRFRTEHVGRSTSIPCL